ncbi:hypothetical protein Misp03_49960 [Microbispora sp. NBRC 16548]|nr:hypothetical protein Misp03_49960 [Microbispora sp. NBRC 16548]
MRVMQLDACTDTLGVESSLFNVALKAARPDYLWDVFIHMPAVSPADLDDPRRGARRPLGPPLAGVP